MVASMANNHENKSFFSVAYDLISTTHKIQYDLYVNASGTNTERFVRVFPVGEHMEQSDIIAFKKKYSQLYVMEDQRSLFLKSLVKNSDALDIKKTEIIKDSAIHYLEHVFDKKEEEFTTEVLQETVDGCRESVESIVNVVQNYKVSDLQDLIANLSFHDFYTFDHSINVSMYSIVILKSVKPKAPKDLLLLCGMGGLLHDLGKLKVPTRIINSTQKLTDEEFKVIKKHPGYGYELLQTKGITCANVDLDVVKRVILEHHENFDGSGYPEHKSGQDIHFLARITAIADVFDAITTKRSYQKSLGTNEAMEVLARYSGTRFDPEIFSVFEKDTKGLINRKKLMYELPDNFEPSVQYSELPLQQVTAKTYGNDITGNKKETKTSSKQEPEKVSLFKK
ncbi:MAG: HD domain-containing protein [Bacteriovoracaceae bacterium]|nr:HD domain-containing protein [Bacteriovoracaceae bacterium]